MPYIIRELPPLPSGTYSTAQAINDSGVVAGTAQDAAGHQRAVYWFGGAVHEIPTPIGFGMSMATGINEAGAIVGLMTPEPFRHRAFLFDGVTVHDLGPAGDTTRAFAINDSVEIAGMWRETGTDVEHAVMWTPGLTMIDLGGFGFPRGHEANAIANAPAVAGLSTDPAGATHAFLWLDGVLTDLGTLGGTRSVAHDVFAGVWPDPTGASLYVVGGSEFAAGVADRRAFLWHKGTMHDLGTLPGWFASEAYGMNSVLQVVGYAWSDPAGFNEHAVVWDSLRRDRRSQRAGLRSRMGGAERRHGHQRRRLDRWTRHSRRRAVGVPARAGAVALSLLRSLPAPSRSRAAPDLPARSRRCSCPHHRTSSRVPGRWRG
jgi:probable HAF family extracellular repeat protein